MAVAAYGALVSLINALDNVHYRAELRKIHVDIKLIESLQEGVDSLVNYVEAHSESQGQRDLWRQISRVAFEAEEMFDLHVVDQLRLRSEGEKGDDLGFLAFNQDVERFIQQVDFIKKDLSEDDALQTGNQPRIATPGGGGSSSTAFSSGKSKITMVGFEEHKLRILDLLTSNHRRDLQIIPIVGMGGIGKTTLAQNVYNDALIVERFDLRIWLTISQEYDVDKILLGLVNDGDVKNGGGNDFHELGKDLYQKLCGRRYLIVMDDMWGIEAWNDLRVFFPNNGNGSRVMMTTRLADLGTSLGSHGSYVLPFLDENNSWKLFCQTIFGQDVCPNPDYEKIGRSISGSCKGLPLEIVVIGSHLVNSDMTKEYWEFVAESMKSFGDTQDYHQHCMEVLYLSYKKLPIHLKLCFLHMRVLQEHEKIFPLDLIEGWIAEGCIKPDHSRDLFHIGKNYLNNLIARNLIAGKEVDEDDSAFFVTLLPDEARCVVNMHDLLRELCIKELETEQFTCSPKRQSFQLSPPSNNAQGGCFHCGTSQQDAEATNLVEFIVISQLQTTSTVESLVICKDCEMKYSEIKRPRLVKMVVAASIDEENIEDVGNGNFRGELVLPTQVRFAQVTVGLRCHLEIVSPCMLPLLWNLQRLSFSGSSYDDESLIVLPPEIWELSQLRMIVSGGRRLALPNPMGKDFHILKYLSTLADLVNWECTKDIVDRIPNLRVLSLKYEDELLEDNGMQRLHDSLYNLIHLQKLEFLVIENAALEHAIFPKSLNILYLKGCRISWKDMTTVVGSLPNLEFLWLTKSAQGAEWKPVEGGFLQLKSLWLEKCNLRCWNADRVHFPKLEFLVLHGLTLLEDISLDIGNVATLQGIIIVDCNEKVKEWGKEIWEEQQSMGNETFRVEIDDDRKYDGQEEESEDEEENEGQE